MSGETAQQLDPLGGITARIFVVVVAAIAVVVALCLSILNNAGTESLTFAALAIALLGAGFGYLIWAAEPYRRQVTRARFDIAFALVLAACILDAVSQLRADTDMRDDWGPIAVALMLMVSGSYRLPIEIVVRTVLAVVVVVISTLLHAQTLRDPSLVVSITVSSTLVIGLGAGAAVYASSLITGLSESRVAAAEARERRDARDRRAAIETFLTEDIESLRREVLPFFRDLKTRDILTESDRIRAEVLSRALRASLVSSLAEEPLERVVASFSDPDGVASTLSDEQRTALRALVAHLTEQPGIDSGTLSLTFAGAGGASEFRGEEGERLVGCISAHFAAERGYSSGLAPFVGLLQLSFVRVDVEPSPEQVSITFAARS